MLAPATEADTFDPEIDVCWLAYEDGIAFGAVTTRLRTDGVAELRLVGGHEFRRWIGPAEAVVCEWAREAGASRLISRGRKGWVRLARTFGWVPLGTDDEGKETFEKPLAGRGEGNREQRRIHQKGEQPRHAAA